METKQTQQMLMLLYMYAHGVITVRDAMTALNINSCTKRASELRKQGLIESRDKKVFAFNSDGKQVQRTHYTEYFLSEAGQLRVHQMIAAI